MGVISECLVLLLVCQAIGLLTAEGGEAVDNPVPPGDLADPAEELLALPETNVNTDEQYAAVQFANTFVKRGKKGKNGKNGKGGKGSCSQPRARRGRNAAAMNPMYLEWHNYYRCLHGVGPLTYSRTLEAAARRNVQDNVNGGGMEHTNSNPYGENLWAAWGSGGYGLAQITGQTPVKAWYDEMKRPGYNFRTPTKFSGGTGHFTQVVWKDTTKLGCWTQEHPMQGGMNRVFVACEYDPPGNMNVAPRRNKQNWLDQVPALI